MKTVSSSALAWSDGTHRLRSAMAASSSLAPQAAAALAAKSLGLTSTSRRLQAKEKGKKRGQASAQKGRADELVNFGGVLLLLRK